ncbi:MAG: DMT family transporter [Chloroflexi bacterium]|nr:DMT family transporter [Chloroflexota bacterium]
MSNRLDWLLFVLLGFFWGSSYLFIKIAVDAGLEPFTLVTLRLLIGALVLGTIVAVARERLPREGRTYLNLLVLGVLSVALPFSLITWAEQSVTSALAAILTAPVPLFVILIAAVFLKDERITANRLVGLAIGLVGVAVLVGFDAGDLASGTLVAEIALVGAAASYAAGGVYARRTMRGLRPMIPALFQVTFALVIAGTLALIFERPTELPFTLEAIFAVIWLGVLGSGLAYLLFFRLLDRWGATRTAMVAYLLPVFGIVLGAVVLSEPVDTRLVMGTGLVIAGIALVNSKYGSRPLLTRRDPASSSAQLER